MSESEGLGARGSGLGTPGCRPLPSAARSSSLGHGASTVAELHAELTAALDDADVPDARGEARDMIAALLDVPRFWPTANRGALIDDECRASALAAVSRRAAGAPFAYAVGRSAFRHLTLDVDERVLIPRQETEVLVDLVLEATAGTSGGTIADVGTGSGAIALALATEGRFDRVIATDVSLDALAVARRNAAHLAGALRARLDFRHGSLLAPLAAERGLRAIVSNPPYVAFGEALALPPSVRDWEPALALFSGDNGMAATAAIVAGASALLASGGLLALEVDTRRASLVAELCMADGRYRDVSVRLDLTGRERFVLASRL
ncbi:MAG TPA: peptide chain release factor N(5)-glutamine methyltransferase [Gemmatimonadaceae bacterium]|nr:peptide chain release factor N(5)-glutamine methyltransferase [Gemmatimonadaceae bacterium]